MMNNQTDNQLIYQAINHWIHILECGIVPYSAIYDIGNKEELIIRLRELAKTYSKS